MQWYEAGDTATHDSLRRCRCSVNCTDRGVWCHVDQSKARVDLISSCQVDFIYSAISGSSKEKASCNENTFTEVNIYFSFVEKGFCIINYLLDNRSPPCEIVYGKTHF